MGLVRCRQCGKRFYVEYPDLWVYKHRDKSRGTIDYYCTWSCIRAMEKGKEARDRPLRPGQHNKMEVAAVLAGIMDRGEDPIAYLHEIGYKCAEQAYRNIKDFVKTRDERLYDRLPCRKPGKQQR